MDRTLTNLDALSAACTRVVLAVASATAESTRTVHFLGQTYEVPATVLSSIEDMLKAIQPAVDEPYDPAVPDKRQQGGCD